MLFLIIFLGAGPMGTGWAQDAEKELFFVAQKAFEDGFYDVAMRYISQLTEQYPQTDKRVEARLLLGQCYFFKSQYLKAYEVFNDLLSSSEMKDATLFWLGETYLKGSDYKQAEKQYRRLIEVYPESMYLPQAYYSLGWVYFEQRRYPQAREPFQTLLAKFPDHQFSEEAAFKLGEIEYNLKDYARTIDHFQVYIERYPQSRRLAQAYFYAGEAYYYQDDFLKAVPYYAQAAETAYDPHLILTAKISLGWSYLRLEKLKLAQKYFDEAVALAREKDLLNDDVLLGQASLYTQMKEYDSALGAYTELITKFPGSPRIAQAQLGRANIYYLQGDYTKAVDSYQKVIGAWVAEAGQEEVLEKAYFGLAWAHLKLGNVDAAVRNFETIKNKAAGKTVKISALTQIGDAYQDAGQFEKAIEVYDQILRDSAESPYTDYVQYRQGIALLKNGKIEAAMLSFQSLQRNFPASSYLSDIKYYLAVALFKKGDWAAAQEEISGFIAGLPETNEFMAEARYILALSRFNLQKYDEAMKEFQKIISGYPDRPAMVRDAEMSMAQCYDKLGQTEEAVKRWKDVLEKYPQSAAAQEALLWLGDHDLGSGNFDGAIAYYQRFTGEFPGSDKRPLVQYELGRAYEAKGDLDEAVSALKRVDDPRQGELYVKARMAIAEILSREVDSASALETYRDILETSPEFRRNVYAKMAEVYKNRKEYAQAVEAYQNALNAPKGLGELSDAQLQFSVGDGYEMLNQRERAVEEYLKLPYLYPKETAWVVKAYLRAARIFEDDEKWEEAGTIYRKVSAYDTDELKFARERLEWIEEHIVQVKGQE